MEGSRVAPAWGWDEQLHFALWTWSHTRSWRKVPGYRKAALSSCWDRLIMSHVQCGCKASDPREGGGEMAAMAPFPESEADAARHPSHVPHSLGFPLVTLLSSRSKFQPPPTRGMNPVPSHAPADTTHCGMGHFPPP